MGTHPIFESDFDCLTEENKNGNQESFIFIWFNFGDNNAKNVRNAGFACRSKDTRVWA